MKTDYHWHEYISRLKLPNYFKFVQSHGYTLYDLYQNKNDIPIKELFNYIKHSFKVGHDVDVFAR